MTLVQFSWQLARERAMPFVDNHAMTPSCLLHTPFNSFAAPLRERILNWRLDHYTVAGLTWRASISYPSQKGTQSSNQTGFRYQRGAGMRFQGILTTRSKELRTTNAKNPSVFQFCFNVFTDHPLLSWLSHHHPSAYHHRQIGHTSVDT